MGGLLREGGEGQRVRWPPSQIIGRGGGGGWPPSSYGYGWVSLTMNTFQNCLLLGGDPIEERD